MESRVEKKVEEKLRELLSSESLHAANAAFRREGVNGPRENEDQNPQIFAEHAIAMDTGPVTVQQ